MTSFQDAKYLWAKSDELKTLYEYLEAHDELTRDSLRGEKAEDIVRKVLGYKNVFEAVTDSFVDYVGDPGIFLQKKIYFRSGIHALAVWLSAKDDYNETNLTRSEIYNHLNDLGLSEHAKEGSVPWNNLRNAASTNLLKSLVSQYRKSDTTNDLNMPELEKFIVTALLSGRVSHSSHQKAEPLEEQDLYDPASISQEALRVAFADMVFHARRLLRRKNTSKAQLKKHHMAIVKSESLLYQLLGDSIDCDNCQQVRNKPIIGTSKRKAKKLNTSNSAPRKRKVDERSNNNRPGPKSSKVRMTVHSSSPSSPKTLANHGKDRNCE